MPLSKDANRVPLQVFAPNDIVSVGTTVDCNGIAAIMFTQDTNFSLVSGGAALPFKAGEAVGVRHLVECYIDVAQDIGIMLEDR